MFFYYSNLIIDLMVFLILRWRLIGVRSTMVYEINVVYVFNSSILVYYFVLLIMSLFRCKNHYVCCILYHLCIWIVYLWYMCDAARLKLIIILESFLLFYLEFFILFYVLFTFFVLCAVANVSLASVSTLCFVLFFVLFCFVLFLCFVLFFIFVNTKHEHACSKFKISVSIYFFED